MINTTAVPANSNSGSAITANFKMTCCLKRILSVQLNVLALGLLALSAPAAQPAAMPANLPLYFESNPSPVGAPAQFIARGHDYQFLISPAETQIVLRKTAGTMASVRMQFAGASAQAQISGDTELPGKINYLTGNDPAQWRTGVATFAKVRVGELYPGVNLVYYGNQQQLEYDFTVAPGATPDAIAIHFDGVDKIAVNVKGELILTLGDAEICQPKPVIYQTVGGARHEINGGYRLVDARTVAFDVGQYDRTLPLVIDPILSYSTYFGGNYGETAWSVAINTNDGSIYMAGQTFSTQFANWSVPHGAYQTNFHGGSQAGDAFVAKFGNLGTNLIYFTYLGGSADDAAYCLAVDGAGRAYVAGATDSPDFPITNAIPGHTTIQGKPSKLGNYPTDAFVAELDAGGSNLIYSTYLGGESSEAAYGIAVDSSDNAYVTGFTYSTNFPTTNAIQQHLACINSLYFNANAFVTKIASNGQSLVFSTYFGGTNYDLGRSIAVDSSNFVYVTGFTASTNFPNTNSFQKYLNGSTNQTSANDAFVAKFDSTGTNLLYSTFLGGNNNDVAYSIAVDNNGAAYVTGWTTSTDFPNTNTIGLPNGLINNVNYGYNVTTNAFLTKITNGVQAGIAYSTVFGGTNFNIDIGYGVALDPAGNVFVVGSTSSTDFPTYNVPGFMCATNSGGNDVFVIAFNTNATALLYSAYLGGASDDFGYGIAVDPLGNAYVIGQTLSGNFPTLNARQTTLNGTSDAFLAKIILFVPPPDIDTNTEPISQTNAVGSSVTFSVYLTTNGTPPFFFQWQIVGTNLIGTNLVDGGNISGATGNILTISPAQVTNSGSYWLIVINYGGSVTSSLALLSITNVPPTITVQPTNQAVVVTSNVTFVVTATGTAPLSYQWQVNGTNLLNGGSISGATTNKLIISNVPTNNSGNSYTVIVTNFGGSVTSSVAILTVASSPLILTQPTPTNQSMAVGATATYAVTAIGTVPLSYHWRLNGTNLVDGNGITGATTNVLRISLAQTTNSGNYTVVVTNLAGSVTSSVVTLTVTNIPPAITHQPTSQTNGVGTIVTLAVTATGTAPLSYQWQVNGTNLVDGGSISGATTNNLIINTVQTNNSGNYTVIVTNLGGSVTSSVATLTVASSPLILTQPADQTVVVGSNATFVVNAIGMGPLSYQWRVNNGANLVNGSGISGATSNVLTISNVPTNNSGNYYSVIVTNLAGSVTSSNALLTVVSSPVIIVQPTNQAMGVGETATFSVTAIGIAPLSYQWQINGTNLVDGGNPTNRPIISGSTTNVLTISAVEVTNSGNYTVIVTNIAGSVTSSNAVLTVTNFATVISPQPTSQTVGVGSTVEFSIGGQAQTPFFLQWLKNGTNLVDGTNISGSIISGSTNNPLTIINAQTNDSGTYWIVVSNAWGVLASSNAVLTVLSSPLFGSIIAAGGTNGGFILSGVGGTNNGAYYVLTSTNLMTPFGSWTRIATNQFDNLGGFIFTNAAQTNTPQEFYLLQMP
jgi:hypothetical protein